MKILWSSNAPFAGSGYGVQTELFTKRLGRDGHKVFIRANYGVSGTVMKISENVTLMPQSWADASVDVLKADVKAIQPDATLILYDIPVFPDDVLTTTRAAVWIPIENDPIPPATLHKAKLTRHLLAMSQFGERELRRNGLDCWSVPHGVDTEVFHPLEDRAAVRAEFDLPPDRFVALTVAANKGFPSRKNLPEIFAAWGRFIKKYPNSTLFVHSNPLPVHHGIDLAKLAKFYEIPDENLLLADPHRIINGQYTPAVMNELYNVADVFLLPSAGEGFGVPAIEAQAAGCPAILSDFTAQSELVAPGGWRIAIDEDDLIYSPSDSHWCRPKVSRIVGALEEALCDQNPQRRADARTFAVDGYDAEMVYQRYMLPALEGIAGINAGERTL